VKKRIIDFTEGSIIQKLILFAVPIVLGELFQNLYNSVDALIVGNYVGKYALAAVSVCDVISRLLVGFFNGMSVGVSVVVSQVFGGHRQQDVSRAMRVSFSFGAVLGVSLSVAGILIAPMLLDLTGPKPEVYAEAIVYLRIYLAGLMFTVIYNIGAGILRAIGDSGSPFRILLISCLSNIILDLLFVVGLRMGVAGVAFATVLSQGISVFLIYYRLARADTGFCLTFSELRQNGTLIRDIVNIGMPSGLQGSLISISNMFVWRYINGFDAAASAGIGIAQRLDKFVGLPCKAIGQTMTTFVSQNVGARNSNRIRVGIKCCLGLGLCVTAVLGTIVYGFAEQCVALFNSEADVIVVGVAMMRTIIPLYFFMTIREVYLGVLRGHGIARVPMFLSLAGMVVIRQIFLAVSMQINYSVTNIYYCYPIAWGATAIMIFGYYRIKSRQLKSQMENAREG